MAYQGGSATGPYGPPAHGENSTQTKWRPGAIRLVAIDALVAAALKGAAGDIETTRAGVL